MAKAGLLAGAGLARTGGKIGITLLEKYDGLWPSGNRLSPRAAGRLLGGNTVV